MGKAEETVDISFIQEKERFLTHYKACKKLQKDTIKLLETVRDLSVCQTTLAEGFYNIYDTSCQFYNTGLKTQDIAKQIDVARTQMVHNTETCCLLRRTSRSELTFWIR